MEKNLVIIVIIIFIILLIFAVLQYLFRLSFKSSNFNPPLKTDSPLIQPERITDYDNEYRKLIEKSKDDYKNFMEKTKSQ